LKNFKPITLLLIANAISGISQGITMIAIPWYFTGILHQEGLFGSIYFLVTAVSLFWGVYAGALIDRYDRRKLFLAMNVAGLFILGGTAAYGFYNQGLNWWMAALPFAATAFIYNIHFPNLYAFAQEITPKENYAKVNSLLEIQGQISFTLAGGIAAILLNGLDGSGYTIGALSLLKGFVVKPWTIYEIFFVDALTYIVAWLKRRLTQHHLVKDSKQVIAFSRVILFCCVSVLCRCCCFLPLLFSARCFHPCMWICF
jgi:DHA3 family macrolide efflux protein-like MFS transporter